MGLSEQQVIGREGKSFSSLHFLLKPPNPPKIPEAATVALQGMTEALTQMLLPPLVGKRGD